MVDVANRQFRRLVEHMLKYPAAEVTFSASAPERPHDFHSSSPNLNRVLKEGIENILLAFPGRVFFGPPTWKATANYIEAVPEHTGRVNSNKYVMGIRCKE